MDGLNWSKGSPNNLHTVAFSAMSVMAFTDFGFNANTPENLHAYGDLVRRALRFLWKMGNRVLWLLATIRTGSVVDR